MIYGLCYNNFISILGFSVTNLSGPWEEKLSPLTEKSLKSEQKASRNIGINAHTHPPKPSISNVFARLLACGHSGCAIPCLLNVFDGQHVRLLPWTLSPAL